VYMYRPLHFGVDAHVGFASTVLMYICVRSSFTPHSLSVHIFLAAVPPEGLPGRGATMARDKDKRDGRETSRNDSSSRSTGDDQKNVRFDDSSPSKRNCPGRPGARCSSFTSPKSRHRLCLKCRDCARDRPCENARSTVSGTGVVRISLRKQVRENPPGGLKTLSVPKRDPRSDKSRDKSKDSGQGGRGAGAIPMAPPSGSATHSTGTPADIPRGRGHSVSPSPGKSVGDSTKQVAPSPPDPPYRSVPGDAVPQSGCVRDSEEHCHFQEKEDFKADSLTHWVRKLIVMAYRDCPDELAIVHRILHEIRAIASSWALFNNVSSLMKAAKWKSHNVFTNNYLRDLSHIQDDMLRLGSTVVDQHKVTCRPK
jgi:hypothetical protein